MQYEYLPMVGQSAGVVIVVHDPDRMPFPEDEGILAVPGTEVDVSIKQVLEYEYFISLDLILKFT